MTTEKTRSILGVTSTLYKESKSERGNILDKPEEGLLELYPAGYTKPSNRDNVNRQDIYKLLYEYAVQLGTEDKQYPFREDKYSITLVPDPSNSYDKNAIHLIMNIFETHSHQLSVITTNGIDLGFIPMRINQCILKNISMVNEIVILKVKANFHKKYYSAKVAIAYGDKLFTVVQPGLKRFSDILEE